MTDPLLNYQSPRDACSGFQTAAWICLLVLGIIYCLGALLLGGLFGLAIMMILSFSHGRPGDIAGPILIGSLILMVPLASGITYIWCAFLVRRASRRAATTAQVVAFINAIICAILLVLTVIGVVAAGIEAIGALFLYGTMAAAMLVANGVAIWLLARMRRDPHFLAQSF